MSSNLFDFSQVKKGAVICRVHAAVVNSARVISINDESVECDVDPIGRMTFDRISGVHSRGGYTYGFIVNCPKPPASQNLAELKSLLQNSLKQPEVHPTTRRAIKYALQRPLW